MAKNHYPLKDNLHFDLRQQHAREGVLLYLSDVRRSQRNAGRRCECFELVPNDAREDQLTRRAFGYAVTDGVTDKLRFYLWKHDRTNVLGRDRG